MDKQKEDLLKPLKIIDMLLDILIKVNGMEHVVQDDQSKIELIAVLKKKLMEEIRNERS